MDKISRANAKEQDFNKKYSELKAMRGKTPIEQLKIQLAIAEFLNE